MTKNAKIVKIINFEDYCAPTLSEQTADVELPWEDDEEFTDNDHYYNAQFRKENNNENLSLQTEILRYSHCPLGSGLLLR